MITFSDAYPKTWEKWVNLLSMLAGVLLGWVTSPIVWLVAGPFRIIALMGAQAAQESGYNSTVCGDAGTSCGILQFQLATIQALGGTDEDRSSPFWSGYYGVKMIKNGLYTSRQWFLIAVPVYGFAVLRFMWTHGTGASDAWGRAWSRKGIGGETTDPLTGTSHSEPRAWGAFFLWRAVTFIPMWLLLRCYMKSDMYKQGRKRKSA